MKLSNLSLIYIALCAFMAASILVVHVSHGERQTTDLASPLSLTDLLPAKADPAATALIWTPASAIEM
jgi:hypothetical protein